MHSWSAYLTVRIALNRASRSALNPSVQEFVATCVFAPSWHSAYRLISVLSKSVPIVVRKATAIMMMLMTIAAVEKRIESTRATIATAIANAWPCQAGSVNIIKKIDAMEAKRAKRRRRTFLSISILGRSIGGNATEYARHCAN